MVEKFRDWYYKTSWKKKLIWPISNTKNIPVRKITLFEELPSHYFILPTHYWLNWLTRLQHYYFPYYQPFCWVWWQPIQNYIIYILWFGIEKFCIEKCAGNPIIIVISEEFLTPVYSLQKLRETGFREGFREGFRHSLPLLDSKFH